MRAEREVIRLGNFNLSLESGQHTVHALTTHRQFNITPLQSQYLEFLRTGSTVEQMVLKFLEKGWLVRFGELFDLMQLLATEKLILNPVWNEIMALQTGSKTYSEMRPASAKVTAQDLINIPFFHGLNQKLLGFFAEHGDRYDCPAQTRLCVQDQNTRDLFVLTSGQAAVLREDSGQQRLLAKLVAPAVFGEGGFLLGKARSAHVVTTQDSHVIRIRHRPEFVQLIRTDEANQLYRRFWVLHALSNSELFQKLPLEAWEDVSLLGQFRKHGPAEMLFNEGTKGASFFIVIQGRVSVWQKGQKINTLDQGHCLGEISLFASHGIRTASVKTDIDSLLIEISAKEFYPLLARHLPLAKELEQLAYSRLANDQVRR